jgi:hypothetical protein
MLHPIPHVLSKTTPLLSLSLMVAFCSQLTGATNVGPDWDGDSNQDAGAIPATAQKVQKDDSNAVVVIRGELSGEGGEGGEGEGDSERLTSLGDYQDMYEIVILTPGQFEISTLEPIGFTEFDSMLSVYDAQGRALLANQDADQGSNASRLGNTSTNGKFTITTPGVVYIAISGSENRPRNANGENIFGWTPDTSDVVGPAFPAGADPITSWSGDVATGEYAIHLKATGPVPSACAVENTESCFDLHPTPFCSDGGCCELVCLEDSFCCEVTWDASCVDHAFTLCTEPPCTQNCPGDLDLNGSIGGGDLAMILANWGNSGCSDLNFDGVTDGNDLALLLSSWGQECGGTE